MVRDFIVFENDGGGVPVKKMAGYHQYHAVGSGAGDETIRASRLARMTMEDLIDTGIDPGSGYEPVRQPGGASRAISALGCLAYAGRR